MSRLSRVVTGKIQSPDWILVFGPEGCGKSTLASHAPAPIWLSADKGVNHLSVARMPDPMTWQDVLESIKELAAESHAYKTLVVDPVNFLEPLLWEHICKRDGKASIEDYGYGKGYVAALAEWRSFVKALEELRQKKEMNIILIAHSQVKKQKSPDLEDFDRYTPAMHESAAALFRQQADFVLFVRIPVYTEKTGGTFGKFKGRSTNQREMRTAWNAAYDAKSRPQLPDPLPLDWDAFMLARKEADGKLDLLKAQLAELLPQFPEETRLKASAYLLEDPSSISRYELTIAALQQKQTQANEATT